MNPRVFVPLKKEEVPNLGTQRAQVLCAIAEAIIDKDFAATIGGGPGKKEKGFRDFVTDTDAFMNYQSGATVAELRLGLSIIEVKAARFALGEGRRRRLLPHGRRGAPRSHAPPKKRPDSKSEGFLY